MAELTGEMLTLALLVAIAFLSGIGITTIGPGGVFVTVALYALTSVSSSAVAGTAHLTFIGTGIVASVAYAPRFSGLSASAHIRSRVALT